MEIPDFLYVASLGYMGEPKHVSKRRFFETLNTIQLKWSWLSTLALPAPGELARDE
jgi:hypothetical protein